VITQNVDNLHEQAGSDEVIHLHGSLFESRSSDDPNLVYPIHGWELKLGDLCEKGSQLRPNIVWFGELVTMIEVAAKICTQADVFLVVGTSMMVYPAASLIDYVSFEVPKYVIDPKLPSMGSIPYLTAIEEKGSVGLKKIKQELINLSA
jgi:NAD-dependent deacetylase